MCFSSSLCPPLAPGQSEQGACRTFSIAHLAGIRWQSNPVPARRRIPNSDRVSNCCDTIRDNDHPPDASNTSKEQDMGIQPLFQTATLPPYALYEGALGPL